MNFGTEVKSTLKKKSKQLGCWWNLARNICFTKWKRKQKFSLRAAFIRVKISRDSADKHHILQEQQHLCRYCLPWQGCIFAGIGLHCFSSSSWGKQAKPEKMPHCLHARAAAEAPAGQPGCRAGALLTAFQNRTALLAGTAGLQTACTQVDGTALRALCVTELNQDGLFQTT